MEIPAGLWGRPRKLSTAGPSAPPVRFFSHRLLHNVTVEKPRLLGEETSTFDRSCKNGQKRQKATTYGESAEAFVLQRHKMSEPVKSERHVCWWPRKKTFLLHVGEQKKLAEDFLLTQMETMQFIRKDKDQKTAKTQTLTSNFGLVFKTFEIRQN